MKAASTQPGSGSSLGYRVPHFLCVLKQFCTCCGVKFETKLAWNKHNYTHNLSKLFEKCNETILK